MVKVGEIDKEDEDYFKKMATEDIDFNLLFNLLEENGFEKPMSRELANIIIENLQDSALQLGGQRLYSEKLFMINNVDYVVIAWGWRNSGMMEEHNLDLIVVKEEKEN